MFDTIEAQQARLVAARKSAPPSSSKPPSRVQSVPRTDYPEVPSLSRRASRARSIPASEVPSTPPPSKGKQKRQEMPESEDSSSPSLPASRRSREVPIVEIPRVIRVPPRSKGKTPAKAKPAKVPAPSTGHYSVGFTFSSFNNLLKSLFL
jgi:hypothetical protein